MRWTAYLLLLIGTAGSAEAAQTFALVDLGAGVKAYAINAAGQITGCVDVGAGATHAYLYAGGTMTDLGTLGGTNSCGYAINAAGQVTGFADTAAASHAFLYSSGSLTDLGTVGGVPTSAGVSINASGNVVGYAYPGSPFAPFDPGAFNTAAFSVSNLQPGNPTAHAFLYQNGSIGDLFPSPPINANFALAINDGGEIGVASVLGCGILCPYGSALTLSSGTQVQLTDLSGKSGSIFLTTIAAINAGGEIVAYGEDNDAYTHGVIYSSGSLIDLGNNTEAFAINSAGDVVGFKLSNSKIGTYGRVDNDLMPFLYSNGAQRTLNMPGVIPTGISDTGWIIANHFTLNHAYLLQPSSVALAPFGLGFGSVVVDQPSGSSAACGSCTVTLTNQTNGAIAVSGIATTVNFAETNNCAASLAPGASCVITVTFTPPSLGTTLGALDVTAGGTQYATLMSGSGTISTNLSSSTAAAVTGTPFTLTWLATAGSTCTAASPSTKFSGPVAASGSAQITVTSPATDTFTLSCTQGAASAQAEVTVSVTAPPSGGGGGGGGAVDLLSLALLLGRCCLGRNRSPPNDA